ncbi:cell division protein FtsQ/DivIB [Candidatus Babeliales bacterium]|nr:cell division protein FtsQ/DivIB [Candidatus Babeliales bacterium]
MARRRKKKKNKLFKFLTAKFFGWLLIIFIALGLIVFFFYQIYNAELFKIRKNSLKSNLKIDKNIGKRIEGKSIFNINLEKFHSYLKSKYPEYKKIEVVKKFPNIVRVQIVKRRPIAQVRAREFYLIDEDGVVISEGSRSFFSDFAIITDLSSNQYFNKGDKIADLNLAIAFKLIAIINKKNLLRIINSLDKNYQFKLEEINISSPETVYFYLTNEKYHQNKIKIIINKENISEKINLLEKLITQKLEDKLSLIRYIDFRFKKVAVGFRR